MVFFRRKQDAERNGTQSDCLLLDGLARLPGDMVGLDCWACQPAQREVQPSPGQPESSRVELGRVESSRVDSSISLDP